VSGLTSSEKTALGCFGLLALAPVSSVLHGWVLTTLWRWFVVPLGVAQVGIVQAIGISSLIALLTYEMPKQEGDDQIARAVVLAFLRPLFALGFCAVVRWVGS